MIETCTEPLPERMHTYHTHIAGNFVAKCEDCGRLWAYWECACDLNHDCGEDY